MTRMDHCHRVAKMFLRASINRALRPDVIVRDGTAVVTAMIQPDAHYHPGGSAHGSVYFMLLDDAAFLAAQSRVRETLVLTASFTVHFLGPMNDGPATAEAKVVHESRRLLLVQSAVTFRGRVAARGVGHFMPSATPLTSVIGYE